VFFARFKVKQENANVPLRASDLPWWNWLLIAAIAAFVSGFTFFALIAEGHSPPRKDIPNPFPNAKGDPFALRDRRIAGSPCSSELCNRRNHSLNQVGL
jgi:hypothetical protein